MALSSVPEIVVPEWGREGRRERERERERERMCVWWKVGVVREMPGSIHNLNHLHISTCNNTHTSTTNIVYTYTTKMVKEFC